MMKLSPSPVTDIDSQCRSDDIETCNRQLPVMEFGKMKTIEAALKETIRRLGIERKLKEQEVIEHWAEIVGEAVARNTKLLSLQDGRLRLHVPNAVWRQELHLARMSLMRKINDFAQMDLVEEIVLR